MLKPSSRSLNGGVFCFSVFFFYLWVNKVYAKRKISMPAMNVCVCKFNIFPTTSYRLQKKTGSTREEKSVTVFPVAGRWEKRTQTHTHAYAVRKRLALYYVHTNRWSVWNLGGSRIPIRTRSPPKYTKIIALISFARSFGCLEHFVLQTGIEFPARARSLMGIFVWRKKSFVFLPLLASEDGMEQMEGRFVVPFQERLRKILTSWMLLSYCTTGCQDPSFAMTKTRGYCLQISNRKDENENAKLGRR